MKTVDHQSGAGRNAGMPARTLPRQPALRYSVLVSALTLAFGASAQTVPEADAANAGQARPVRSGELQVVVVTADHRPVTVQKTAASITSVGGEAMREKGQTTLSDALQDVPAVEMQASPQGGQLFIRGVGTSGDSNWIDPSVSLMFDGVYSGRAERVFASMYDIDRVEVLRGPQGTLYGRNATGGSMNIISESPSNKLEGALNAQVGSYKLRYLDAALNVPVSEALALRLALMREKRDGYFSNGGGAADRTGVRLKALFKPSKDVSVLATVDVLESKGLGTTTVPRAHTAAVPPFVNWPVYPTSLYTSLKFT
jgi:iron complex outermembrane receptor protein